MFSIIVSHSEKVGYGALQVVSIIGSHSEKVDMELYK